jgi:hypothetical protein
MHPRLALYSHLALLHARSRSRLLRYHVPRYHPSRCWMVLVSRHLPRRHWAWLGGGELVRWLSTCVQRHRLAWLPYMPQARHLRRLSNVDSSGDVCPALALSRCSGERATRPSSTKSAFWSTVVANKSRCVRPPSHVVLGRRASWSHMLRRLEDNRCLFTTWAGATSRLMVVLTLLAFGLLLSRRMT